MFGSGLSLCSILWLHAGLDSSCQGVVGSLLDRTGAWARGGTGGEAGGRRLVEVDRGAGQLAAAGRRLCPVAAGGAAVAANLWGALGGERRRGGRPVEAAGTSSAAWRDGFILVDG